VGEPTSSLHSADLRETFPAMRGRSRRNCPTRGPSGSSGRRQLRNSLLHDFPVDDDGPLVATESTRSAALKGAGPLLASA